MTVTATQQPRKEPQPSLHNKVEAKKQRGGRKRGCWKGKRNKRRGYAAWGLDRKRTVGGRQGASLNTNHDCARCVVVHAERRRRRGRLGCVRCAARTAPRKKWPAKTAFAQAKFGLQVGLEKRVRWLATTGWPRTQLRRGPRWQSSRSLYCQFDSCETA